MLRFEIGLNLSRLRFEACAGRRTVYAYLRVGARTWWAMRWDTERAPARRFLRSRDGRMGWTFGTRSLAVTS